MGAEAQELTRWEYKTKIWGGEDENSMQPLLNHFGQDGWELCTITVGQTTKSSRLYDLYVFKRIVREDRGQQ